MTDAPAAWLQLCSPAIGFSMMKKVRHFGVFPLRLHGTSRCFSSLFQARKSAKNTNLRGIRDRHWQDAPDVCMLFRPGRTLTPPKYPDIL
jgi:hypothetical protein